MPTPHDALLRQLLGAAADAPLHLTTLSAGGEAGVGHAFADAPLDPRGDLDRVLPVRGAALAGRLGRLGGPARAFLIEDASLHRIALGGGARLVAAPGHPDARWVDLPHGSGALIDGHLALLSSGDVVLVQGPPPPAWADDLPPALQPLIGPLAASASAIDRLRAAGHLLRLFPPPRPPLPAAALPEPLRLALDALQGRPAAELQAARDRLAAEAAALLAELAPLDPDDDEALPATLAADLCGRRAELAALRSALRAAGSLSPEDDVAHDILRIDAAGVGLLPWLREALSHSADVARWAEELAFAPEAWWAAAWLPEAPAQ